VIDDGTFKECHPKGTYSKLNVNKIRPCKIKRNFEDIAYEVDFLEDLDISLNLM
jgi:hypothetical protein